MVTIIPHCLNLDRSYSAAFKIEQITQKMSETKCLNKLQVVIVANSCVEEEGGDYADTDVGVDDK